MEVFIPKTKNLFSFVSPSRGGVDDVFIGDGEVCKISLYTFKFSERKLSLTVREPTLS